MEVWLCPFKLAVSMALWLLVTVPEVAVKVALLWPEGTVTLGGADSNPLLLLSDTAVALEAVEFNVTVHRVDPLLPSEEGVQAREVSCAGCAAALPVSVNVWETPFNDPVSTAV